MSDGSLDLVDFARYPIDDLATAARPVVVLQSDADEPEVRAHHSEGLGTVLAVREEAFNACWLPASMR